MASGDGQFDLRALQRVGDFTNDRAEWKRWSFVFRGYVGAASPRLLELMTRVTELQGEITYDALNEDDNAMDHGLHYVLALVLKGDALNMLMNQEPGRGLACWRELVLLHEPPSAGHQRAKLVEILNGRISLELGEPRSRSGNDMSRTTSRRQLHLSTRKSRWWCLRNTSVPTMSAIIFA